MRSSLHGWFVFGALLPVAALVIVFGGDSAKIRRPGPMFLFVEILLTAGGFAVLRVLAGVWAAATSRRQRPHALFTPLYEQDPHRRFTLSPV